MYIICLFLRDEEAKLHIQIYLYKVILEGQKHKKPRPTVSSRFWELRQQSSKDRDSIPPPTLVELHESIHLPKVTKSLGPLFGDCLTCLKSWASSQRWRSKVTCKQRKQWLRTWWTFSSGWKLNLLRQLFSLPVCLCIHAQGGQKRASDPLQPSLSQMAVSHHVGARNQPRVLRRSSQGSEGFDEDKILYWPLLAPSVSKYSESHKVGGGHCWVVTRPSNSEEFRRQAPNCMELFLFLSFLFFWNFIFNF